MSLLDTLESHLDGDAAKCLAATVGADPEQASTDAVPAPDES
jgi:hypothetical protein